MKKYLFGISALVLAIAFSAFTTKPTFSMEFKLKSGVLPIVGNENAVELQSNWSEFGTVYGDCTSTSPADLACTITLSAENEAQFFHEDNEVNVLNTRDYANAQNPKVGYIVIETEAGLANITSGQLTGEDAIKIQSVAGSTESGFETLDGSVSKKNAVYDEIP